MPYGDYSYSGAGGYNPYSSPFGPGGSSYGNTGGYYGNPFYPPTAPPAPVPAPAPAPAPGPQYNPQTMGPLASKRNKLFMAKGKMNPLLQGLFKGLAAPKGNAAFTQLAGRNPWLFDPRTSKQPGTGSLTSLMQMFNPTGGATGTGGLETNPNALLQQISKTKSPWFF